MSTTEQLLKAIDEARYFASHWEKFELIDQLEEVAEIVKRDAEIVRCGNCEHRPDDAEKNSIGKRYCDELDGFTYDDQYCSYGKRKEDKQ